MKRTLKPTHDVVVEQSPCRGLCNLLLRRREYHRRLIEVVSRGTAVITQRERDMLNRQGYLLVAVLRGEHLIDGSRLSC